MTWQKFFGLRLLWEQDAIIALVIAPSVFLDTD